MGADCFVPGTDLADEHIHTPAVGHTLALHSTAAVKVAQSDVFLEAVVRTYAGARKRRIPNWTPQAVGSWVKPHRQEPWRCHYHHVGLAWVEGYVDSDSLVETGWVYRLVSTGSAVAQNRFAVEAGDMRTHSAIAVSWCRWAVGHISSFNTGTPHSCS